MTDRSVSSREMLDRLAVIRKAMVAAHKRDDLDEYRRLGAEHRAILHAARPDIKAAWEQSRARLLQRD